jgi:hypothetical protein
MLSTLKNTEATDILNKLKDLLKRQMNSKQESEKRGKNKKKDVLMKDVLKPTPCTSGIRSSSY